MSARFGVLLVSGGRYRWFARLKPLLKPAICLAIAVPLLSKLVRELNELDKASIISGIKSVSTEAILAAIALTAISFFAMACYDNVAMRAIGRRVPTKTALQGGFVATSLGQTLGFGLLVGSLVRWRYYRHLGVNLPQAGLTSGVVAGGFTFGFAVVLAGFLLLEPAAIADLVALDPAWLCACAAFGLAMVGLAFAASVAQLNVTILGKRIAAPKWRILRANIMLAFFDVVPAAIALWVLLPNDSAPTLLAIIPVYLAALGLGLASNAPGGLGVLEMTCLLALPGMPAEDLLAGLILFRCIFYAGPAILGLGMLLAREFPVAQGMADAQMDDANDVMAGTLGTVPEPVRKILQCSRRAEAWLALGGDKEFLVSTDGRAFLMFAECGNSLVAISDPVGNEHAWPEVMAAFEAEAKARFAAPIYYKLGPNAVTYVRGAVAHISSEAEVAAQDFSLTGSSKRELRRKLRQVEKAGVELNLAPEGTVNMAELYGISDTWEAAKTGQRGFSIGRCDPRYLRNFDILEARCGGRLIGSVSLWRSGDGRELSIDVMRLAPDAPDGTMHALCVRAVEIAAQEGRERCNLCAVPFFGIAQPENWVERAFAWVYEGKPELHGAPGLYRFKNAFRPNWAPRYVAAPSWFDLACGLIDAHRLIHAAPVATEAIGPNPEPVAVLQSA